MALTKYNLSEETAENMPDSWGESTMAQWINDCVNDLVKGQGMKESEAVPMRDIQKNRY